MVAGAAFGLSGAQTPFLLVSGQNSAIRRASLFGRGLNGRSAFAGRSKKPSSRVPAFDKVSVEPFSGLEGLRAERRNREPEPQGEGAGLTEKGKNHGSL
jgi:hypothetical protein